MLASNTDARANATQETIFFDMAPLNRFSSPHASRSHQDEIAWICPFISRSDRATEIDIAGTGTGQPHLVRAWIFARSCWARRSAQPMPHVRSEKLGLARPSGIVGQARRYR